MLRQTLLALSRSERAEAAVKSSPLSRGLVRRYVAGETPGDAVRAARELAGSGLQVTFDHLGEHNGDPARGEDAAQAYLTLLDRLADAGLAEGADVSLKLSAFGLARSVRAAVDQAARVCVAAARAGATVTVDTEEHPLAEPTFAAVAQLRKEHPGTGAVVQAYLRRSEQRCRELVAEGARVRLCKGAYDAPPSVAYGTAAAIDASFVRCLKVLMAGQGYPMVATHDPRLIEIASALAVLNEREPDSFEYQMLYGVRPGEQRRMAGLGALVRVYVPYGDDWYSYLVRRVAERPGNLAFAARALLSRS